MITEIYYKLNYLCFIYIINKSSKPTLYPIFNANSRCIPIPNRQFVFGKLRLAFHHFLTPRVYSFLKTNCTLYWLFNSISINIKVFCETNILRLRRNHMEFQKKTCHFDFLPPFFSHMKVEYVTKIRVLGLKSKKKSKKQNDRSITMSHIKWFSLAYKK